MKKILLLTAILFFITSALSANEIVVTKILSGSLGIKKPQDKSFSVAKVGDTISVGSWIITDEDTDVFLTFYEDSAKKGNENSTLQIGSNTKLKVSSFNIEEQLVKTKIDLRTGSITSNVQARKVVRSDYRVRTRQLTAAVRGTEHSYRTDVESTHAAVTSGTVSVTPNDEDGDEKSGGDGGEDSSEEVNVTAGEQTDDLLTPSVDIKLQGARQTSVFFGNSPSEIQSQKENSAPVIALPFSQNSNDELLADSMKESNKDDGLPPPPPIPPEESESGGMHPVVGIHVHLNQFGMQTSFPDPSFLMSEFQGFPADGSCVTPHYHAFNGSFVTSHDGNATVNDPDPSGCGFGMLNFAPATP